MLNRGGPLSKLVGGTIGLAKEYKADKERRKESSIATTTTSSLQPDYSPRTHSADHPVNGQTHREENHDDSSTDEEEWLLDIDEAQQELDSTRRQSYAADINGERMLQTFAQRYPPPQSRSSGLSSLVILPQRRPKSQHKGFVRAYAPVLNDCGISQDAWLEFLDGFEKSLNKSSWFHVTNAGVMVAGNVAALTMGISPLVHLVSTAIHVSIEASRRGYLNHQSNKCLDMMNEQFFKSRGLYCMVVKYEPSSSEVVQNVDMESNISQSIGTRQTQSKWKNLFSNSSMRVQGNVDMPETAPLVFPSRTDGSAESESSVKHFGHVMQDYKDRRAAAKFESEDPHGTMPTAPRIEFASVYGDPNSVANSGGFISLATKGTRSSLGPPGGFADKMSARRGARKARRKERSGNRPLHKMLKADALYLMVTNLPDQRTLESVAAQIEREDPSH